MSGRLAPCFFLGLIQLLIGRWLRAKHDPCGDNLRAIVSPTYILEVPEGDKLDDVPHGRLAGLRAQPPVVAVQELHGAEVGSAHADDYDGHGEAGGVDDGVARLVHVRDHAVGDDEQHKVLLQRVGLLKLHCVTFQLAGSLK